MAEYPQVGEPSVEVVHRPSGQVHEQLREVELRIDLAPAAGEVRLARIAAVRPPRWLPTKSEFLRLRKDYRSRKNSLFYRTRNGVQVGDLYMSLIHTCKLNGTNPFDYLTALHNHATELA
ncbi:MAG: hypothetical protein ABSG32_30115 [Terriglobia bacterium]